MAPDASPSTPAQRRRRVWWVVGGIAVVVVLIGAALGTRFGLDPTVVDSPMIGQRVPDISLPYLERDGARAFSDVEGLQVINFWASWCVPCRNEHDDLLEAAARYGPRGVTFTGVVFQDQAGAAIDFLDAQGRGYDHVTDPGSEGAIAFGVFGIPETYVIDGDGVVRAKIVGESNLGLLSRVIEDVLAGREPGTRVMGQTQSR